MQFRRWLRLDLGDEIHQPWVQAAEARRSAPPPNEVAEQVV